MLARTFPTPPSSPEPETTKPQPKPQPASDVTLLDDELAALPKPKPKPEPVKPKFSAPPPYKPPPPTPLEIAAKNLAQIDMDGNKFSSCVNATDLRLADYAACMHKYSSTKYSTYPRDRTRCPYVGRVRGCADRWKAYAREVAQLTIKFPKASVAGATKVPATGYPQLVSAVVSAGRDVLEPKFDPKTQSLNFAPGSFAEYRKAQGKKDSWSDFDPATHKMCRLGDQPNPLPRNRRSDDDRDVKKSVCPGIKEVVADLRAWGRSKKGKTGTAFVESLDKYWLMSPVFHDQLDARMGDWDGRVIFDGSKRGWDRLLLPPDRQAGSDRLLGRLRQPKVFSSCLQGNLCMYMDWLADTSPQNASAGLKRLYPDLELEWTPIMRATMRDVHDVVHDGRKMVGRGAHVELPWTDRSAKPYAYEGKERVVRMTPADFVGRGGPFKKGDRVRLVHEPKSYSLDSSYAPCATVPAGTCGVVRTTPGPRVFNHRRTNDYGAMYDVEWDASQTAVATEEGCERRLNDTMRAQLRSAPVFALESCGGGKQGRDNAKREEVDNEEEEEAVAVSATYGEKRGTKDVTAVIDKLLQGTAATMRVTNGTMGGDPSPNFPKHLRVFVKQGDAPRKMVFKANEHKTFQVSRLRQRLESAGASGGGGAAVQNLEGYSSQMLAAGLSIAAVLLFAAVLAYRFFRARRLPEASVEEASSDSDDDGSDE